MNSTIKSLVVLSLFSLVVPTAQAMEKEAESKSDKKAKSFMHKPWKKTKKFGGQALDKAKEHPYMTAGALIGGAGLAGAALYKNSGRVQQTVDKTYGSMKKRTRSFYENEKNKGVGQLALKLAAVGALGFGAYKLNQNYTLWDKAKGYMSDAWVNTQAVFGKKESLWEQFNQLTTGKKVAIAAGTAAGAGLVGWLGWKAYKAYTKGSENEIEKCLAKFTKSLAPKQLEYAEKAGLLEKAKSEPLSLIVDEKFYESFSEGQRLKLADLVVLIEDQEKKAVAAA